MAIRLNGNNNMICGSYRNLYNYGSINVAQAQITNFYNVNDADIQNLPESLKKTTPKDDAYSMLLERFKVFKEQDEETGHFDMALEVEGKKLFVHKYFLATASTTFNAMFSTRWNTSNAQVIKIENPDYTYDAIYQLISFIYSCQCSITAENVFVLTDMAEYYGIPLLKEKCHEFLCAKEIAFGDLENMVVVAVRYSMDKLIGIVKGIVKSSMRALIESESFLGYKKPLLEFMSIIEKSDALEEGFFDAVCKWAVHQTTIKAAAESEGGEAFDFDGCLKAELKGILCNIKFKHMSFKFIKESVVSKRSVFTPKELYEIVLKTTRTHEQEEDWFKMLFEVAEDIAKEKCNVSDDDKDLGQAIKEELADIIPVIKFHRMSAEFLIELFDIFEFDLSLINMFQFMINCRKVKEEEAFKAVYLLAEKQISKKQSSAPFDPLKLHDAVKRELADVLALVKLQEMDADFWLNFAIDKGFSFSPTEFQKYFEQKLQSQYRNQQERFKSVYDLAEKLVLKKQELSKIKYANIYETIKDRLVKILPYFAFHEMKLEFLMDSVVGRGLLLSTTMIRDFFLKVRKDYGNEEIAFKGVYRLAEKQAMEEQAASTDNTFNLIKAIKDELIHTLPIVCFSRMSQSFVNEFVVPKEIITAEETRDLFNVKITVKSGNAALTGIFNDNFGIMKAIPTKGYFTLPLKDKLRFAKLKFKLPTAPSTVTKMKGCDWYLCLDTVGVLNVKSHTLISSSDYLIAEMKSPAAFVFDTRQPAFLSAASNHI